MASKLDWMGKYESKFGSDSHKPIVKKRASTRHSSEKNSPKRKNGGKKGMNTLDRFIKSPEKESKLFDDDFGKEDFILATQRWQMKNAVDEIPT